MKKLFVSKSAISKIALALVLIILFQVVISRPVEASGLGGTLLSPIVNLVVYLADGAISILQNSLTNAGEPFTYIDLSGNKATLWGAIITLVIGIALVAGAIVATVLTAGTAAAAIVAIVAPAAASIGATVGIGSGVVLAFYKQIGEELKEVVFGNSFVYSNIFITPETILKDQIALFNVNFFQDLSSMTTDATYELAITIRGIIQGIYGTIRDISIMAMLIVIVYIAIRRLMSLNPREQSKYRESFANCIVGAILIILMHFIMSMSTSLISMFTSGIVGENLVYECNDPDNFDPSTVASNEDIVKKYTVGGALPIEGENIYNAVTENGVVKEKFGKIVISGENKIVVSASNFLELARYKLQQVYDVDDAGDNQQTNWTHIGWAFVYVMLVILTLAFTWMYAKRFLYMAGLTMFAPLVGLMYPINKVDGSRAQTLNLWLKEYIGNLVIQPFHMLLYTILVGGAMAVALDNPVYVIVALMGMTFIEKLLKDLVGIQDTRIGGLGNALQDTNRAIKTATRATKDAVSAASRTIDGVARGAVGLSGKVAGGIKTLRASDNSDAAEEDNAINLPRSQEPPPAAPAANAAEPELPAGDELALPAGDALETSPEEEKENPILPRMLEAYDEGFGTDAWDAHEREGLARAANEGMQPESIYSDEEFAEQLRASGYSDEEIEEARRIRHGEPQMTAEQLARGLDENGNPIAEDASLYGPDKNTENPIAIGASEDGMEMIDEEAYMSEAAKGGPVAIGGASEDGMEMMDEAAYMQGADGKGTVVGENSFDNYNMGEGDLGEVGAAPQIPAFMDADTASKVAQERMDQLEEEGGRRFTSRSGVEAVTDGKRIVADFAGMYNDREVDPAAATAQKIPLQKAVGQNPGMNLEMDANPKLSVHRANASAGGSSSAAISGGISGESSTGGGNVTRIGAQGTRNGSSAPIEFKPNPVDETVDRQASAPGKGPIQFNPAGDIKPENARDAVVQNAAIAREASNVTAAHEATYAAENKDIGVTIDKGFEVPEATAARVERESHFDASASSSGVIQPELQETEKNGNRIEFIPPQVDNTAPEIPAEQRQRIEFNPNATDIDRSAGGSESRVINPESSTSDDRRIQFTPPPVDNTAPEIPAEQRRTIAFNPTADNVDRSAGRSESRVVNPESATSTGRRIEFDSSQRDVSGGETGSTTRTRETRVENPGAQRPERSNDARVTQPEASNDVRQPENSARPSSPSREHKKGLTEEQVATIVDGIATTGRVAGTVVNAGIKKQGDVIEGVLSMAVDAATGNVGGVVDAATGMVTGTVKDSAEMVGNVARNVEYRGTGQISDDARYLQREGFKPEEAREINKHCDAYKIDDKRNKALVGKMYKDANENDREALTKLAAKVIKAKKDGLARKDVEAYLNKQSISSTTKDALLVLFEKAHR